MNFNWVSCIVELAVSQLGKKCQIVPKRKRKNMK
jgi:hypothetical protein